MHELTKSDASAALRISVDIPPSAPEQLQQGSTDAVLTFSSVGSEDEKHEKRVTFGASERIDRKRHRKLLSTIQSRAMIMTAASMPRCPALCRPSNAIGALDQEKDAVGRDIPHNVRKSRASSTPHSRKRHLEFLTKTPSDKGCITVVNSDEGDFTIAEVRLSTPIPT